MPADPRLDQPALAHAHRDFARIRAGQTVAEALGALQRSDLQSRIVYFYVLDAQDRLCGVLPTRRLLLAPPTTRVDEIMERRVISLPAEATLLDACEFFIAHRLLALPIVDESGKLLGVIDVDRYTDEIRRLDAQHESEAIFQLIGVHVAAVRQAHLAEQFRRRFPWLLCNIGGGLACAAIAGAFSRVLQQVLILALFIPVVLSLAEAVSIQSLTFSMQLCQGPGAALAALARRLVREAAMGLMLGAAGGALVAVTALLWQGAARTALCILASMAIAVMAGAMLGLLIPWALHRAQRDPKLASGPLVLALTDATATTLYLGLASWWLL
jgi:magnesium transporter